MPARSFCRKKNSVRHVPPRRTYLPNVAAKLSGGHEACVGNILHRGSYLRCIDVIEVTEEFADGGASGRRPIVPPPECPPVRIQRLVLRMATQSRGTSSAIFDHRWSGFPGSPSCRAWAADPASAGLFQSGFKSFDYRVRQSANSNRRRFGHRDRNDAGGGHKSQPWRWPTKGNQSQGPSSRLSYTRREEGAHTPLSPRAALPSAQSVEFWPVSMVDVSTRYRPSRSLEISPFLAIRLKLTRIAPSASRSPGSSNPRDWTARRTSSRVNGLRDNMSTLRTASGLDRKDRPGSPSPRGPEEALTDSRIRGTSAATEVLSTESVSAYSPFCTRIRDPDRTMSPSVLLTA